ncbi:MAG: recombinase family protein [Bacillota bacterium]|nr:recombinase family protein [Bacillota bacterium]
MRVRVIEPKREEKEKKKVCAYVRVSTDHEKQQESLENQARYFEMMIRSHSDYEYAGLFIDQGISGTTDNRPAFQEMLAQAREGKIDRILTKSISRFARSTTVMLEAVRELKELGVEVCFEKENIGTLSGDGELMLTVLAAFAQEESRSISENLKWRFRNGFRRGEVRINARHFLGYDKDDEGNLVVNGDQARIIRQIYDWYLDGMGIHRIAKTLQEQGITTLTGKTDWSLNGIRMILTNEKMMGDCLCQKTCSPEGRVNHSVINRGQVDQVYIRDNHPPIISREKFLQVQALMEKRRVECGITQDGRYQNRYPYSGLLFCSQCGAVLKRRIWNSNNASRKVVWQCSTYIRKGKKHCLGTRIDDAVLDRNLIRGKTIIEEVRTDGQTHYRYTRQGEPDQSGGRPDAPEKAGGGLLPGINGPGGAVVQL